MAMRMDCRWVSALEPLDDTENLPLLRVPPYLLLGEHEPAVDAHLESASSALDELYDRLWILRSNFRRQTGGSRLVVSNDAVFNGYAHGRTQFKSSER